MRVTSVLGLAALLAASGSLHTRAGEVCDRDGAVPVHPVLVPADAPVLVLGAPTPGMPRLERSRFTGQPLGVVYNDPTRVPGSVDPELDIVPLPRTAHFKTRAVYPRGY